MLANQIKKKINKNDKQSCLLQILNHSPESIIFSHYYTSMSVSNQLDLFVKGVTYYFATLAPKDWFSEPHRELIFTWFSKHDQVLGYTEVASRKHLHVLFSSPIKKTFNVTRQLTKLFETNNIPHTEHVTINVRKSNIPIGYFHYLTSDLKDSNGKQCMIKGWKLTWIQKQCRDNLKLVPKKLLSKDTRVVNNVDGPSLIRRYAEMHHMPLRDKRTFIEVVVRMGGDKYRFHTCKKKDLLADTLAECGHDRCSRLVWESEFHFIED